MDQHDAPYNDVNTSTLLLLGLLGALLLVVISLLLMVIYYTVADREDYVKRVSQPELEIERLRNEQLASLTEYRWTDQKAKVASIPIDRAMALVVDEIRAGNWDAPPGTTDPAAQGTAAATEAAKESPL